MTFQNVIERVTDRVGEIDSDRVATSFADEVLQRCSFVFDDSIRAGVESAIEQIDDAAWDSAIAVIEERVGDELEQQARQIALGIIRELAAKSDRVEVAAAG